jgi:glutathione S-transferase
MKLYFSDPNHPYTKFLQLVSKFASQEVSETVLKKEETESKLQFGSTVAFEGEVTLFDYRAIAVLLASKNPTLLGDNLMQRA